VEVNLKKIEQGVRMILEAIGENPNREGLIDTPLRVAKMYEEIFFGLKQDPKEYFDIIFSEDHDELVLVKDISFYSMCEHHLIPFFGKAHVAYLPQNGKVAGLSRLARAVEAVASRPQLQERMTSTIADALMEKLNPYGVMIMIEAEHMCMTMRGVKKPGSKTITTAARGNFTKNYSARSEVLSLMKN
jgi:GTP cyclohydrolase IA